jgi:hypothetical protein
VDLIVVANIIWQNIAKDLKESIDTQTFGKFLGCFGKEKTKKIVHKFGQDVLPVLLAHAFQVTNPHPVLRSARWNQFCRYDREFQSTDCAHSP